MSEFKAEIEKTCKFVFTFTNIDTMFIDTHSNIQLEYGYTQVPEVLKHYWRNVNDLLHLHNYPPNKDAFIHSTSYKTNFISVKLCSYNKYLGSIVLGPYLSDEPNLLIIEQIIIENNLPISMKSIMNQYYLSLPLLSTNKAKLIAESLAYSVLNFDSMRSHNVNIEEKKYNSQTEYPISLGTLMQNSEQSINMIEKRYINENELLHAVEMGDIEKLDKVSREWSNLFHDVTDRIPTDPLRSRKNLAFVLNTLLRKAAEKGGLPLIDVHSLSEKYAIQIEQTTSIKQLSELLKKMRLGYCKAVRKFSLRDFTYTTKKAIELIRKKLDSNLSLKVISNAIYVSPFELSRQFKKETGLNITEYINIQRINEAIYIIENQTISITQIAHMVGYNDVNYFTKIFKKLKGVTPSEYRKSKN